MNSNLQKLRRIGFVTKVIQLNNAISSANLLLSELFPGESNITNENTFVYAYNAHEEANNIQVSHVAVRANGQVILYFSTRFSGSMRVNFIGFLFE